MYVGGSAVAAPLAIAAAVGGALGAGIHYSGAGQLIGTDAAGNAIADAAAGFDPNYPGLKGNPDAMRPYVGPKTPPGAKPPETQPGPVPAPSTPDAPQSGTPPKNKPTTKMDGSDNGDAGSDPAPDQDTPPEDQPLEPSQKPAETQPAQPLRGKDATDAAKGLGYDRRIAPQKAPFNSHGQPVFSNGKNYITPDVDSHSGGMWKQFNRQGQRTGTLDADGNRIGK